ncbi:MAG: hypothetical protein FWC97_10995 [Treponema sp.]|nr:hypothetical protein [Treponema sp.]
MCPELINKFDDVNAFIKETTPSPVDGSQKAVLNRKGNQFFNDGKIEDARRIFMTTNYTDGLSRIGDYYKSEGRNIEALKMYWLAPNKKKSSMIIEELAGIIHNMIKDTSIKTSE